MPNELNTYRDVHQQAKKAIQQARQLYRRILRDQNTKKMFYKGDDRCIKVTYIPEKYSEDIKQAVTELDDARAVIEFTIRNPHIPQQPSRSKFQEELDSVKKAKKAMERLQNVLSLR